MGLLSAIIFGFLAGFAARTLLPGQDRYGCFVTCLIGVVGATIGKLVSTALGGPADVTRWTLHGFGISVLGAIILLVIFRMLKR
jgi:uncharacterized membrane protein YeaQ/YmgE (transglycosylase-associated protein family)